MSSFVNTEEMGRAARIADSAADSMRRSANTVDESARNLVQLFEQGYGGPGLRLIELLENAMPALESVQASDFATWKARALEAENTVLKWEARATALDHANLDAILSALEDPEHQAEEEAEKAFYRNEVLEEAAADLDRRNAAQNGQTNYYGVAAVFVRALKSSIPREFQS